MDMEEPITVTLDRPADDFFIKLDLLPRDDEVAEANGDRTVFKFLPKNKLADGTSYKVTVSARPAGDEDVAENYKILANSSFRTNDPPPLNPRASLATRVAQALTGTPPKILTGKYIDVSLKSQVMVIFEDGKALDSYPVSSGKAAMPTPPGNYQIHNKAPRAYSKEFSLYMPNWMAFVADGKMGIHELPEWPGGYKEGANHLGVPVSHGCIRLGVGPAKRVYDWAEIGTPVIVY
jgi:lipoprotein-anchoring transpeptidase ErfK/SrfK